MGSSATCLQVERLQAKHFPGHGSCSSYIHFISRDGKGRAHVLHRSGKPVPDQHIAGGDHLYSGTTQVGSSQYMISNKEFWITSGDQREKEDSVCVV